MRIAGMQSLSLLDFPSRVAAIVFTQGCPFRCGYCHNPELLSVHGKPESESRDVLARIKSRRKILDGVVVTGGEPTIHPDLPDFLSEIKAMGLETKLDTNGVHPRMIEHLLKQKLVDYFAMDVKHLWNSYASVTGVPGLAVIQNCRETMKLLQGSGVPHEFRTTVYPALHTEEDLVEIASQFGPGDRYALQEMRYEKTYAPDLARVASLDLEACANRIRLEQPGLYVEVRR